MLIKMKLAVVIVILFKYQGAFGLHREYSSRNTNRESRTGRCHCNYTEIFTQLPYFIQALGSDDKFSFAFQGKKGEVGEVGPMGPTGYPGNEGRKGEQGSPGQRGLPGTSIVYEPKSTFSRSYSPSPEKGEIGLPGRKGQKGEPGNPVYKAVLKDGSYIEVKGDKGNSGRRGRKGDIGPPGTAGPPGQHGLSIQGEKGSKGEPAMLPDIELLRGRPGPRGPPGNSYEFNPDILARVIDEQKGRIPILVPVAGPPGNPGLSIVGEKGEPGQGALKVANIRQLTGGLSGTPGTLVFVEKDESLYVRVVSGWREVPLGKFIEDKTVYPSPLQSTIEKQAFDASAKHYFSVEKPIQTNQYGIRHKKRKRIPVANQN